MPGNQYQKVRRALLSLSAAAGMLLACSPASRCQDMPKGEASTSYSYIRGYGSNNGGTFNLSGGSASVALNLRPWLGLAADYGGYSFTGLGYGLDSTMYTYLFGPRISFRRSDGRLTPFGQFLVGGSHLSVRGSSITVGENAFALAAGGGVDMAISRHFSVRVAQVEYLRNQFQSETGAAASQNNFRFSAGVVLRFGTNVNRMK